jgi:hypothetical protein
MKTRNGFVSNSSSSSFIIAVDKQIKSRDQTVELLVTPDELTDDDIQPILGNDPRNWENFNLFADRLWEDISIHGRWCRTTREEVERYWPEIIKSEKTFFENNKNNFLYKFSFIEYEDNDVEWMYYTPYLKKLIMTKIYSFCSSQNGHTGGNG